MPSQHHAIALQTDCMVLVLAPVVRLPDSHVYALWPGWTAHICPEAFGRMAEHFCQTLYDLAEGLNSGIKMSEGGFGFLTSGPMS